MEAHASSLNTIPVGAHHPHAQPALQRALHPGELRRALPAALIESELFRHEKGAFTGASKAKPGRFELADRGTLLLDEIGDLAPALQTKLLRVADRWDEAADPQLDVVAYSAPLREHALTGARGGPAMEHVGIDLHKKESQICILTEGGN